MRMEVISKQNGRTEKTSTICGVMFRVSEIGGTNSIMCHIAEQDDCSIDIDDQHTDTFLR